MRSYSLDPEAHRNRATVPRHPRVYEGSVRRRVRVDVRIGTERSEYRPQRHARRRATEVRRGELFVALLLR